MNETEKQLEADRDQYRSAFISAESKRIDAEKERDELQTAVAYAIERYRRAEFQLDNLTDDHRVAEKVNAAFLDDLLEAFKKADDERLEETYAAQAEAEKWKAEGDWYGWNFHQGRAGGNTSASIIFYRVRRMLEAKLAEIAAAKK